MESVIVGWGKSEDREAGSVKSQSFVRVRGYIKKIGYIEVFAFDPVVCKLVSIFYFKIKMDKDLGGGGEARTKISWPSRQSGRP